MEAFELAGDLPKRQLGVGRIIRFRGTDPGLRAFGDQRPFELGDGAEDLRGKYALWRRRIDRIAATGKARRRSRANPSG